MVVPFPPRSPGYALRPITRVDADGWYADKAATETHIASSANPHSTTAAQVGAYTTGEADAAFAGIAVEATLDRVTAAKVYVDAYIDAGDRGTTDNSAAIQAAIDAADAMAVAALDGNDEVGYPDVVFDAADYRLDSAITWKKCNLVGQGSFHGTRLQWNGGAAIPITRPDELRFQRMTGMLLSTMGATRPTYWLDIQGPVDFGGQLRDVHFGVTSAGAIRMGGWFNLHWRDLRFDGIGGYAIEAAVPTGQYKSSFLIDGFTYDHQASETLGEGVLYLGITGDNADIGTVHLANGRIEVNGAWTGDQAVVHLDHTGATSYNSNVGLHLDNVTYQDESGMASDALIRRTGSTSYSDAFFLTNVRTHGLGAVIAGDWPATTPAIPVRADYNMLSYGTEGMFAHRLTLLASDETWDHFIYARKGSEAADRFRLDRNGVMYWGDGTNAPDTALYRSSANALSLGAGDHLGLDGTWNGGLLWFGSYALWVDSTGDLRIKNGAPSSDTDGTVVGTQS